MLFIFHFFTVSLRQTEQVIPGESLDAPSISVVKSTSVMKQPGSKSLETADGLTFSLKTLCLVRFISSRFYLLKEKSFFEPLRLCLMREVGLTGEIKQKQMFHLDSPAHSGNVVMN